MYGHHNNDSFIDFRPSNSSTPKPIPPPLKQHQQPHSSSVRGAGPFYRKAKELVNHNIQHHGTVLPDPFNPHSSSAEFDDFHPTPFFNPGSTTYSLKPDRPPSPPSLQESLESFLPSINTISSEATARPLPVNNTTIKAKQPAPVSTVAAMPLGISTGKANTPPSQSRSSSASTPTKMAPPSPAQKQPLAASPAGTEKQQRALHKPKSKLRLRLKLTPPYEDMVGKGKGAPPQQGGVAQGGGKGRDEAGARKGGGGWGKMDGENKPPTSFGKAAGAVITKGHGRTPSWSMGHSAGKQMVGGGGSNVGDAQVPDATSSVGRNAVISKPYPVSVGQTPSIPSTSTTPIQRSDPSASSHNTYPAQVLRGQPQHGIHGGYHHIAVQRPALTAQTFAAAPSISTSASARPEVPKLYEPAVGVGIHEAPSPDAIRRARSNTIQAHDSARQQHQAEKSAHVQVSSRYLSPHSSSGQTTPTRSSSLASQQTAGGVADCHSSQSVSTVNLSLTISRHNSYQGSGLSPSSPLRTELPNGNRDSGSFRNGDNLSPSTAYKEPRLSVDNKSATTRETTPSSFGNVDTSHDSDTRACGAQSSDYDAPEVLQDQEYHDSSSRPRALSNTASSIGWDAKGSTALAYASDNDETAYPKDDSLVSGGNKSTYSSPFSQEKHVTASDGDLTTSQTRSRIDSFEEGPSVVSEATTAMTEEKVDVDDAEGNTSTGGETSLDSGNTSTSQDRSRDSKDGNQGAISDIFTISDQQLSEKYKFVQELGFGNWGSVWMVKPKNTAAHPIYRHKVDSAVPPLHPSIASQHHPHKLAIKLVHRSKTPTTAARVRALWSEMKIVRSLRDAPHPSIIGFDSFVITPSYALVVMPCLNELIPVNLKAEKAKGYFRQLASAVAYLHENGITHNDIKPSNIIVSHANVPVLVDFGFAQKWDMNGPKTSSTGLIKGNGTEGRPYKPFWSEICWGTPEYLSPQRAKGEHHDERLSDVWALGITFFEILCGSTPFEMSEDEDFSTPEQLAVYYERTVTGAWVGQYYMKPDMEGLLHSMILPDVGPRITASQAACHGALAASTALPISTPPFVRDAAAYHTKAHKVAKKRKSIKAEAMVVNQAPQPKTTPEVVERSAVAATATNALVQPPPLMEVPAALKDTPKTQIREVSVNDSPALPLVTPIKDQRAIMDASPPFENPAVAPLKAVVAASQVSRPMPATAPKQEKEQQGTVPVAKKVRRIKDFDSQPGDKGIVRQRSFDQNNRESYHGERTREALAMRRPASALALRSANEFDQVKEEHQAQGGRHKLITKAELQRQALGVGNQARLIERSSVRTKNRHARVLSDSNVLNNMVEIDFKDQKENHAVHDKMESRKSIDDKKQDKWVHFQTDSEHISDDPRFTFKPAPLPPVARPTSPVSTLAAPESLQRLDRIAGWIKDVEKIVETARVALEEAGVETATSEVFDRGEMAEVLEVIASDEPEAPERMRSKTPEPKTRHSRTASAFSTFAEPATPPGWARPSFELEEWKPTHLRRQRSDLTGMNIKSSFRPISSTPAAEPQMQPLTSEKAGKESRKLRTHRSTPDLGKLVADDDPYSAMLASEPGIARRGDGWSSMPVKSKEKNAGFAKKDTGLKGWLSSVKAKFGKK